MGKLEGKVAIITGGNSGIGLATAKEFKEQGARVVITGRDQQTLDEARQEIGGEVLAVRSDTSSLMEMDKLFAVVKEKFGKIDVLFVNAGIGKFAPVEAVTEDLFDSIMDVNFKGAYFTIQKALPLLNDNASIVLNASMPTLGCLTQACTRRVVAYRTACSRHRRTRQHQFYPWHCPRFSWCGVSMVAWHVAGRITQARRPRRRRSSNVAQSNH